MTAAGGPVPGRADGAPPAGPVSRHVLVAGAGVAGRASARVLLEAGAAVTVLDRKPSGATNNGLLVTYASSSQMKPP